MIIITGTKRSGTSMWMQLLQAAGLEVIGEAFPRDWSDLLREGNQEGYYESRLRRGVYYATNPDPRSGAYLAPEDCSLHGVKIFIPGLTRTDLAFIRRVVATVRPWREYVRSVRRLYGIEDGARAERVRRGVPGVRPEPPRRMPPALEWWFENFLLLGDVLVRQYPVRFVAFDAAHHSASVVVPAIFRWLEVGDGEAAAKQVKERLRTAHTEAVSTLNPEDELPPRVAAAADDFYRTIYEGKAFDVDLIKRMNAANEEIAPQIELAIQTLRS